ncbi:MAG: hypothetical protein PHS04_09860 [Tissierellia bacterium]|nr:hypothetical protein [Tissierellia bacterium]
MTYKRKAKKKEDFNKNPEKVDTTMGKKYLKQGRVKNLNKRK